MAMAMAATPRDAVQLWTLARLLVNQQQLPLATRCLELCVASPPSAEIARQAEILLAECCLTLCAREPKEANRELWWNRYNCAQRCVYATSEAVRRGESIRGWDARLHKCKYLLVKSSKAERSVRDRLVLQSLCDSIRWCHTNAETDADSESMRVYFVSELRASLVAMYADSVETGKPTLTGFEDSLKFVRASMPSAVDTAFQSWLIEVSCHVLVILPRFTSPVEATNALGFADQWIRGQESVSSALKQYHLLINCFLVLRTGEVKKMGPLVQELKALRSDTETLDNGVVEPFLDNILDALELEVTSRYDPTQAVTLSMKSIHQVQANLQLYATRMDVQTLLLGLLFDMLFIHCDLQRQQCRFYEMGVSLAQLLKLFIAYKHFLEPAMMLQYYVAKIHTLIAKYAFSIGRVGEAETHVRVVVQRFTPPIQAGDSAYPLHWLRVLVDVLDAILHCSAVSDASFVAAIQDRSSGVHVNQICPTIVQLNLAAQILQMPNLRGAVHNCGNLELTARYELALCKWLWAAQELRACGVNHGLHQHDALEQCRPDMLRLLREALESVSAHVNCAEATAEIMALFGPKLIEASHPENGEDTLKSALRLSLHSKNVLLQVRLLVDVFRLYGYRQLAQAQATTAEKYEKKVAQLHRRIAQAQVEQATITAILGWSPP